MKIRSDYVSNSSSSSFIIDFEDKGACIDEGFMKLLKHVNGIILRCHCASKEQLKELEEKAKTVFNPKVDIWTYEDDLDFEVSVNSKHIMAEDGYGQMDFIRLILQNENGSIYCQCGDDYGEDLSNAVQVATIMETRYKQIEISGDDHFDYNSIRGSDLDL
jgi:hypothetical protein